MSGGRATSHLTPVGGALWAVAAPLVRGISRARWKLAVRHLEPLPAPPFILAGNHPSSIDPVVVGAVHRHPVMFLAVDELYGKHAALDVALQVFGAVEVPRAGVPLGAMRSALDHLRGGGVVGVFPEGTRVPRFGDGIVKPGAAWLAARAGVPLVPVALEGTDEAFSMDLRFGRGSIRMVTGPPMRAGGPSRSHVDELMGRWQAWVCRELEASGGERPSPPLAFG